jgi:hypothetical protein
MLKRFVEYAWQLPQHILALVMIKVLDAKKSDTTYDFKSKRISSFSLGEYIFCNKRKSFNDTDYMHEVGHSRQSLILGPLYLIIIGIPSCIGNLLFRIKWVRKRFDYYSLLWEANADKLGGVERC